MLSFSNSAKRSSPEADAIGVIRPASADEPTLPMRPTGGATFGADGWASSTSRLIKSSNNWSGEEKEAAGYSYRLSGLVDEDSAEQNRPGEV